MEASIYRRSSNWRLVVGVILMALERRASEEDHITAMESIFMVYCKVEAY